MKNPKHPKMLHNVLRKMLQNSLKDIRDLKININQCPVQLSDGELAYGIWFTNKTSKTKNIENIPSFYYPIVKILAYIDLFEKGRNSVKSL